MKFLEIVVKVHDVGSDNTSEIILNYEYTYVRTSCMVATSPIGSGR